MEVRPLFARWFRFSASALFLAALGPLGAQAPADTPYTVGLREQPTTLHALVGADVVPAPGELIPAATVIVRDGLIEALGPDLPIPAGARVWNLQGHTLYPGLIEVASHVGQPEARRGEPPADASGPIAPNPRVRPDRRAADSLTLTDDLLRDWQALGFTTVHSLPRAGVFRGQSALVTLTSTNPRQAITGPSIAQVVAFETSTWREQQYPSSLIGATALIRQTYLDAQWLAESQAVYAAAPQGRPRPLANDGLAALQATRGQPTLFFCQDELDYGRALALAREFNLRPLLLGNGYEYREVARLAQSGAGVIVPLLYPKVPAVETPEQALEVPLDALQHWEQAPGNAAALAEANVKFALTTFGLSDTDDFWPRLRQAIGRGLPPARALAALTTEPATWLGAEGTLGRLAPGRPAHLLVATGDLFTEKSEAEIAAVWVDGQPRLFAPAQRPDLAGTWALEWLDGPGPQFFKVSGTASSPKLEVGETTAAWRSVKLERRGTEWVCVLRGAPFGLAGEALVTVSWAFRPGQWLGTAQLPDGTLRSFRALPAPAESVAEAAAETPKTEATKPGAEADQPKLGPARTNAYPAGDLGLPGVPEQPAAVVVRGATIWTSGPQGTVEGADLLVVAGKVMAIGPQLTAPAGALEIDGRGKHVAPGIIDAHSHIAISRGVNEGTDAVTTEVRLRDALNPTDISIYRQLAGGVTGSNLLHGSSNPMGGQSAAIKLRWGGRAEDLLIADAPPSVKFALGENVKRSNTSFPSDRYPQTRLGVEQIMADHFAAALEYGASAAQGTDAYGYPVRRNLRLESLYEIATNRRFVHIHSYRADEILMFVRLAQRLGLRHVTFQHVLEGYKVAREIAEIPGGGGSLFADMWSYKIEMYDAIPWASAIMHREGVITSVNSDNAELARRLNIEAAKAMKYGGLSPVEALGLVTIFPARQMQIDQRTGSLEPGKDADFVLWSASPLSPTARAEQTWIEGRRYFSLADDAALRARDQAERARLVALALPERLSAIKLEAEAAPKTEATPPAASPPRSWFAERGDLLDRLQRQGAYGDGRSGYACTGAALY